MRFRAPLYVALFLTGCSSASELPSGGPYGGGASDAGVSGDPDAPITTIAFVLPDSGVGTGTGTGTGTSSSSQSTAASSSGVSTTASTTSTSATSTASHSGPVTWTYLYNTYLSSSTMTIGDCDSSSCHRHTECSSPSACYSWIGTGTYGALANNGGLLSWDNGYMPATGPSSDPQAEADFAAWIAAGSLNN